MAAAAGSIDRSGAVGITRRLAEICGPPFARFAGAADEVAGAQARWVAVPGAPQAAAEVLRLAAAHDLTVVPRGAGTKIDWGATPAHVDIMLDTGRLAGICHRPADGGVAEIGAGTPLRAAQAALERAGLRLALDAPSPGATVGGVLATDESGPLRHRHGGPCEQLVGLRYLDAAGELISAGGGAPGLELARLLCGSQGGLGVLVSATLRVQPVPASRAWVTRPVWSPLEVDDLVREVLAARLDPAAVELDLPARANRVRPPLPPDSPEALARARHPAMFRRTVTPAGAGSLTVLLEGGPADVAERADGLRGLLGGEAKTESSAPQWWRRYPFGPGETALRIEVPVSDLHAAVYALRDAAGGPVPVRGSAGQGVLHAGLPGTLPAERVASIVAGVRAVLLARRGRCVVVAAPPPVREAVDLWGELASLPRLRAAKEYLDPHQRLAPGRLPGGL
ncbi:FAD-binding oxidoreductase [Micromonospora carbonacea]|uniref:FAD-binding oxidoreductase n=1 Tax=Micromonospora carbonacea TaxID=47853 RepID=A0A7H8XES2_9ACTN|nr:FAD-binding oxidoreductase [Micromonospora carbonacea]MBB5829476.1 glycolate oxidase FAD binding subunit [Micromonospora carbonacea]QLD23100.1 FAD-binding oxidoreductase [Micromonospora carbonacea]